jgi:proline iminopeptidase
MKTIVLITIIILNIRCDSQTKSEDSTFIRFHLYGKGEPVFVLSGGPGNNCMQEEDVAIAIGKNYQAILLEQRGTGLSMPPRLDKNSITLEAYFNDLLFVMDSLKIQKARFYGHSWGAMYASAFAVKYPARVHSLILTGPGYLKPDNRYTMTILKNRMEKLSKEEKTAFYNLSNINPEKLTALQKNRMEELKNIFNTYDLSNKEWKFARINRGFNNSITQSLLFEDLSRIHFDITQQIGTLKIPINIITCKEDPLAFLTDEYKKFAPQAGISWMDHCGHFPMYEQPETFYQLLFDALE